MAPTVQSIVWNWQATNERQSAATAARKLRRQAVIQACVTGIVGAGVYFWLGHHRLGMAVWVIAAVVLLLGIFAPSAFRPLRDIGQRLGHMVGRLLAYVLLTPLYFFIFMPGAYYLRARHRDPLHRQPRGKKFTCWIARHHAPTHKSYARQFTVEDKAARGELRPVGVSLPLPTEDSL